MFDLKPRAVARGLEIYLLVLLGGLTAAAVMVAVPALDIATVTRNAEPRPLSPASADAAIPERSAEPGRDAAKAPVAAAAAEAGGSAGIGAAVNVGPTAVTAGTSNGGQIWSPGAVSAGRDPAPDLQAVAIPHTSVGISYSLPDAARAHRSAKDRSGPIAGRPLPRPRHSRPSPGESLSAEAWSPALRAVAGSACPVDSDPQWREPDPRRAPVLVCNPYHRRLSLDAF